MVRGLAQQAEHAIADALPGTETTARIGPLEEVASWQDTPLLETGRPGRRVRLRSVAREALSAG